MRHTDTLAIDLDPNLEPLKAKSTEWHSLAALLLCFFTTSLLLPLPAHADWIKGYFRPGTGTDSLNRFMVYQDYKDSSYLGYGLIALGDQNGDGLGDVLVLRAKLSQDYADDSAFLFLGGVPPSTLPAKLFVNLRAGFDFLGDIDNDGKRDIGGYSDLLQGGLGFKVHASNPELSDSATSILPGLFGRAIRVAHIDSDSTLDLVVERITDFAPDTIYVFGIENGIVNSTPTYIFSDTSRDYGRNVAVHDLNGDGYGDILVSQEGNYLPETVYIYLGGLQFDGVPDLKISRDKSPFRSGFGRFLVPVGDFNADGYDDIYIGGGASIRDGIFFCGPTFDTILDMPVNTLGSNAYFVPSDVAPAGDFNHDGYEDIVLGWSEFASFYIHFGGPNADSLPDIVIEGVPGGFTGLGFKTRGIGDFNGDGIDDIAVSAIGNGGGWFSSVHFFAGFNKVPTDVADDNDLTPNTSELRQNYPNPFNPETTIEFDLANSGDVSIDVYNELGQKIRRFEFTHAQAGSHRITWDGRTDRGDRAGSGIYFYQLTVNRMKQTKKMILLK